MSLIFADGSPWMSDDISDLANGKGPDFVELAQEFRAVRRGDVDGFHRSKASLHEQFDFALIPEPRHHPAVPGRIETREQHPAALHEFAFEFEFLFK